MMAMAGSSTSSRISGSFSVCMLLRLSAALGMMVVVAASTTSSSTSSSSRNHYESVRLLNEYGEAAQLEAATAASNLRGQCIVAIRHPYDGSIWIVSPLRARQSYLQHRTDNNEYTNSSDSDDDNDNSGVSLLQPVTFPETRSVLAAAQPIVNATTTDSISASSTTPPPTVYLACSGVRADADWLLYHLRVYGKLIVQRYGGLAPTTTSTATESSTANGVALIAAALKRRFWGYTEVESPPPYKNKARQRQQDGYVPWTGTAYADLVQWYFSDDEGNVQQWGRPLGIRSMILSTKTMHQRQASMAHLDMVEPSGLVSSLGYYNENQNPVGGGAIVLGMGYGSSAVVANLIQLKKHALDEENMASLAVDKDDEEKDDDDDDLESWAVDAWIWHAFAAAFQPGDNENENENDTPCMPLRAEIYTRHGTVTTRIIQ